MRSHDALPPINFAALADALLARAATLVPMWLPGGVQRGHEYVCGSVQGGAGDSCAVNLSSGKWADFAGDERGNDLVSLYAACFDLAMGQAALQVAREEGLEDVAGVQPVRSGTDAPKREPRPVPVVVSKPKTDEGWQTMVPVPEFAPAATFSHQYRQLADIQHTADYRLDGQLLGYVVRFGTSDGGKETLPLTFCTSARDGASKWCWKQWDEPRPLYIPAQTLPAGRTVVLVEGEKKADVLHALLEAHTPGVYLVASWPGGCKAWKKALWDWLTDCAVMLWPDCDAKRVPLTRKERETVLAQVSSQLDQIGGQITENDRERANKTACDLVASQKPLLPAHKQPGMEAMLGIGALLRDAHACTVQMLPIPEPGDVVDGWDCADAINTDGWDADTVLAFFARAQPLQAPESAAMDAAAKKIDGLVGTAPVDCEVDQSGMPLPWWLKPYWDADKSRWLVSRKLVIAALEHDEALCNVLGLNELSNAIDARVPWPWEHGKAGPITGAVDLRLGDYLTRTYGLPSITRAALMEAIETVAHARPFHPIRLWLAEIRHDGIQRIDKWLIHALGESPESLTPAMAEYLKLVGRYWLLGMVNRVMEPGCKFDYCPVLEGPGGFRKSTLVEALAGTAYFSDTHFDVSRGKEGQEQVQGLWMYEIAELANFGKAEIGLIKAFITAKIDRYRPSYGRVVEAFARQCVLVGTTNESTYLRDRTGNRRFWPIPVRNIINIDWVRKYREQLLAEAYVLYGQGMQFTPSVKDELRLFVPVQESRLVETAVMSDMLNVLTRQGKTEGISSTVNCLTEFITIAQMALALGVDSAKSNAALEQQMRNWFEHEGWTRVKKMINGVRAWGYARPDVWPRPEPQEDLPAPVGVTVQQTKQEADDAPF